MTTKLLVYNGILRALGESRIANLTEARRPRYEIDDIYDALLEHCLEEGYWNFAIRTIKLAADPALSTSFGYTHTFNKPIDWVRTAQVSTEGFFTEPFLDYQDETDFWFADIDPLFFRYVSNDTSYGLDLSRWPESFTHYVKFHGAVELASILTSSLKKLEAAIMRKP